jgi:3-deoxy-D-manno-octulosonic-acid transferase
MKKLFKTLALVCATTIFSLANPLPKPTTFAVGMYNVNNTLALKVFVQKAKGDKLKLELKDNKGVCFLTTYSSKKNVKEGFMFDLKNLNEGQYTLVISNDTETFEKVINLIKAVAVESKLEI